MEFESHHGGQIAQAIRDHFSVPDRNVDRR
jgi:hypothetical protein